MSQVIAVPIVKIFRERFNVPVVLVNDANAAADSKHYFDGFGGKNKH